MGEAVIVLFPREQSLHMPKRQTPITSDNPAIMSPRATTDRLYRSAYEAVRQRQRYAALVAAGALDDEQEAALGLASACDAHLLGSIASFEHFASNGGAVHRDEEWYRKGTTLWQASRDYERRHAHSNEKSKRLSSHSAEHLGKLAMDFDLEASALLALQHALTAYQKVAPDAQLVFSPPSLGASGK